MPLNSVLPKQLAGRWQSTLGNQWGASPVFMPPNELYLARDYIGRAGLGIKYLFT